MTLKIVICYAHADKDMCDELDRHLSNLKRQQLITSWSDREISPGSEWKKEVNAQLGAAHLILLLISSDFMASDYCYSIEMDYALKRHNEGSARVIPILLRPLDWENAPFYELQVLPDGSRPVTEWKSRDGAWENVVLGIRKAIGDMINLEIETKEDNISSISVHNSTQKSATPQRLVGNEDKPSVEKPLLICLAIDVSDSMKQPIIDHTGKTIKRWSSVSNAIEHFVQLGVSWVQDPETQNVLPLYYLMAYGFGFRELMHTIGRRKKPGGSVRDLLAHPSLPSLPSASDLSEHWNDYKNHLMTQREYTGDLFGSTPTRQALIMIRNRIREEYKKKAFTLPTLLLIISDGLADDGENPLPIIKELHSMGVITLSCYLADKDILASRQLYKKEQAYWSDGAKLMFQCASPLHLDNYVMQAMFDYLSDYGWKPQEGARLFAQVNQAKELENFLEVLLRGTANEKRA
jgi:hypothetical protein